MPSQGRKPKMTVREVINELVERSNSSSRRLRSLEQGDNIINTRLSAAEKEILAQSKQGQKSLAALEAKIAKIDSRMSSIESTVKEIIKELRKLATTTKVKELEQMIEVYSPIKSQFVTKEEAERIAQEAVEQARA